MRRDEALGSQDHVPLELWIGPQRVDVRVDADGIHFRQARLSGDGDAEGLLRWHEAIALALLPPGARRELPSPA